MTNKIYDLHTLAEKLKDRGDKKVVLCHGVFDLLHIGHLRHFKQAKENGDILVVTLSPDEYVEKGPFRPAFEQDIRSEAIASVDCVDYVAVNEWRTAEDLLRLLKPDFYAKGSEFKDIAEDRVGKIAGEVQAVEEIGARMVFTEDIVFSSSTLINRHLSNLPQELDEYISLFRKRHSLGEVQELIDRMSELKVLVLGETIVDEYFYCEAIGKSSKDPIIAAKKTSFERFAGGSAAVANHVAGFAGGVEFVSVLGEEESHEDLITESLNAKINARYFRQKGAPTIAKRRYIDRYFLSKLIEIYNMDDSGLDPDEEARKQAFVAEKFNECDMVLVADYGHGTISPSMVELLCSSAPFLAVNTQANAGNRGFHTISRYRKADYVSLARHEAELEFRTTKLDLRTALEEIGPRMGCRAMTITTGAKGCAMWKAPTEFAQVPAFATRTVDRVGSGDAFLSVASMAACLDADHEVIGFLGNVAGAIAVETVGNKDAVGKKNLERFVTALLK